MVKEDQDTSRLHHVDLNFLAAGGLIAQGATYAKLSGVFQTLVDRWS